MKKRNLPRAPGWCKVILHSRAAMRLQLVIVSNLVHVKMARTKIKEDISGSALQSLTYKKSLETFGLRNRIAKQRSCLQA